MQVVRVYSGDDGESHFQDLGLPYQRVRNAERTAKQPATEIEFRRYNLDFNSSWHPSRSRHYVITLEGEIEIGVGDGSKRIFKSGDIMLADDLTGRGHTTRAVGNTPRVSIAIELGH